MGWYDWLYYCTWRLTLICIEVFPQQNHTVWPHREKLFCSLILYTNRKAKSSSFSLRLISKLIAKSSTKCFHAIWNISIETNDFSIISEIALSHIAIYQIVNQMYRFTSIKWIHEMIPEQIENFYGNCKSPVYNHSILCKFWGRKHIEKGIQFVTTSLCVNKTAQYI